MSTHQIDVKMDNEVIVAIVITTFFLILHFLIFHNISRPVQKIHNRSSSVVPLLPITPSKSTLFKSLTGPRGYLAVYPGPMFSEKTTRLIKEASRYGDICKIKALYINSHLDSRGNDEISSHSSAFMMPKCFDVVKAELLSDVNVSDYEVIAVDEAQFYSDLFDVVSEWICIGKAVFVAGLDGTSEQKEFGQIARLCHIADVFEKQKAICSVCVSQKRDETPLTVATLTPAPFTKSLVSKDSTIAIGGADKYTAVCRAHL